PARYTLSLHDALPIFAEDLRVVAVGQVVGPAAEGEVLALVGVELAGALEVRERARPVVDAQARLAALELLLGRERALRLLLRLGDRKSTRLNSSHVKI